MRGGRSGPRRRIDAFGRSADRPARSATHRLCGTPRDRRLRRGDGRLGQIGRLWGPGPASAAW
ncbi:MAG: hypothetical protein AVDCRST_MAG49-2975 [uncultured Thermomicrobiales bacterium]|uniref:Uncharacterized protein n=1 Tax=uncultured Thermomicrobiales bacterium TaxID=1645740 RepID=A0A6J4URZ1_9BACT|nr:MAG: hypothetical protein AVDCRST_MAG49-2975 [uncultured Thermomicrobiales bacterium]